MRSGSERASAQREVRRKAGGRTGTPRRPHPQSSRRAGSARYTLTASCYNIFFKILVKKCFELSKIYPQNCIYTHQMAPDLTNNNFALEELSFFPSIANGKINFMGFIKATSDLLVLVDRLGKVFTPVKHDMQGNIDKIKKNYRYDEDSCLLELMLEEINSSKPIAAEGVLWLNRALLFFELTFQEILVSLNSKEYDVNMKKVFTSAYEGSVKKYHNWITQQLFHTICKMSPTLPQILKSFNVDNQIEAFEARLFNFNQSLHLVRCEIDNFFRQQHLFNASL